MNQNFLILFHAFYTNSLEQNSICPFNKQMGTKNIHHKYLLRFVFTQLWTSFIEFVHESTSKATTRQAYYCLAKVDGENTIYLHSIKLFYNV